MGARTDSREKAAELRSSGVEPLQPPFEVYTRWAFEIADPWGNVLGFTHYVKEPGRARG
jgi:hypothetical protein